MQRLRSSEKARKDGYKQSHCSLSYFLDEREWDIQKFVCKKNKKTQLKSQELN